MKKQQLYAFWSYDQFPYILGGTVAKINDDSTVETKEYGPGYCFTPLKIVPLKAGMIIKQDLEKLKARRTKTLRGIELAFDEELKKQWCFIK